jgi:hypothetical protein
MERPSTSEKILPRMEECRCRKKICSWNRTFTLTGFSSWLDVCPVWTFIRTERSSKPDFHPNWTFIQTGRSSRSLHLLTFVPVSVELTSRWWVVVQVKRCVKAVTNSTFARRAVTCGVMLCWSCTKCQWTPNVFLSFTCYKYNISTKGFANKIGRFYEQLLNNFLTIS